MTARIQVRNRNVVINSQGIPVVMGRNTELVLIDAAQRERAKHRVPYGARLLVDNETPGHQGPEARGMGSLHPADHHREGGQGGLRRPGRGRVDARGDRRIRPASPTASSSTGRASRAAATCVRASSSTTPDGQPDHAGQRPGGPLPAVARTRSCRSRTARRSMPATSSRVSRARAARTATSRAACRAWPSCSRRASPRTSRSSATSPGRIEFGKDYKNKRRILIVPEGEGAEPVEYLIPKTKRIAVQEGDYVERGDLLIDGNPVPHDILRVLGIEKLAEYLVNEIQEVYRLQGVKINDKHIETIARQMLQKVEITDAGESTFLIGEQVDKQRVRGRERQARSPRSMKPAKADPVLLGITKASLQTKSFISAASFQETTRVLTEAAVSRPRRHPAGPQGERHRRPPDPGGYRRSREPPEGDRRPARPRHPGGRRRRRGRAGPDARAGARRRLTSSGAQHEKAVAARRRPFFGLVSEAGRRSTRSPDAKPPAADPVLALEQPDHARGLAADMRPIIMSTSWAPCFSLIRREAWLSWALLSHRQGQPSSRKA